jgi:threonine/homoserine/homoserine lactone efflux protein
VLNTLLAVVLLALVSPIVTHFDGKPGYVQVALVLCTLPVLLVAAMCLSSALRPGSLGRLVRRLRRRSRG